MPVTRRLPYAAASAAALAVALSAQSPVVLQQVHGSVTPEALASPNGLAGLGDVNGDGIPDFVAGAPSWPMPHPTIPGATIAQVGKARVYSGASLLPLFEIAGTYNLQALGRSVANVGDVNGDGVNDVAAGAPMSGPTAPGGAAPPAPQVQVWSGAAGTLLYVATSGSGGFSSGNFGFATAGIGDVGYAAGGAYVATPDGFPDFVVGANTGNYAEVRSGVDGALLYTLNATTVNPPAPAPAILLGADDFGGSVAGVGDVDGDGRGDFLVGARQNAVGGSLFVSPNTWYAGAALLMSGNGSVLNVFVGAPGDQLGTAVAGVGDLNGDGVPDFAVSSLRSDVGGVDTGSVTAYSGATYAPLWTVHGLLTNDLFGASIAGVGDVTADGVPDVFVGTPTTDVGATNTGSASLLDGATGARLGDVHGGAATDLRGRSVSGYGDYDGDGFSELLVGTPGTDVGGSGTGSVAIVSYGPYLRPSAAGAIPGVGGGTFDMLRLNGSGGGAARRVDVAVGAPFTVGVVQPPTIAAPAPLYCFGIVGVPGAVDETDPGLGFGTLCFAPPALNPLDPRLFLFSNSFFAFDPTALIPVAPPGSFAIPLASGLPFPTRIALAGVAFDGAGLVRTNAVLLSVQ